MITDTKARYKIDFVSITILEAFGLEPTDYALLVAAIINSYAYI